MNQSLVVVLLQLAGVVVALGALGWVMILSGYLLIVWYRHRDREEQSLKTVCLQVAVPRDNEIKIDAMEQVISSLYSIKKGSKGPFGWLTFLQVQPHISFEIVGCKENIRFYIVLPEKLRDLVEKQIHGSYPGAEIRVVEEPNIFSKEGKVEYAWLILRNSAHYPIQLFKNLAVDPLAALTSALAKMGDGEGAHVQILISPADAGWKKKGRAWIGKTKKAEADPEKASYKVDAKTLEAVDNKVGKNGFMTTIRIVVCSGEGSSAKAHMGNIRAAFEQFNGDLNGLKGKKIRMKGHFMVDFIYRYQPMVWWGNWTVLNAEELATMYHFPNKTVETPHIFWLNAKSAPAPAGIATSGLYIGKSVFRGIERPVYITESDRERHMYIVGRTGTGKTELMKSMILQDIQAGKGICVIDPHDLAEQLLGFIPPARAEDVIYFNPADEERPMGMNLLEANSDFERHMATSAIIEMMYKIYDPHKTGMVGPRFEHAIRNAMLSVMDAVPGGTFIELVQVLTRPEYVQELLPRVKDPVVRRYWTDQIAQTTEFHKSEVLDYIVSKFGRFITNKTIRNIIGQSQSAFNFRKVMDEGKILIMNLSKGMLGEENSNFLGLVLVPRLLAAAMSRADIPESQRRPFYLYVDEFQNFATPDFATILSEARKYKLNLTVANQFTTQMDDEVKNAVFGNVGTLLSFRVGVGDANYLQHEFSPTFSEADLLNIERFHVYIKTIVNNEPVIPFSMDVTKDFEAEQSLRNAKLAEAIKQLSRLKYGKDVRLVESEIATRSKL
ncbi:type IV secretion system DNA-binding domain-containing protein [Candidatus Amesbacteria bacterium]|nr:type IV secretion system DNA-binding domain-containing protein [Candidatus Amesbacteria bacterium]MBI2587276.1 type IV secretion system DNA-binding domain-containing protein [Candidatus Amesbacteria bacterium]